MGITKIPAIASAIERNLRTIFAVRSAPPARFRLVHSDRLSGSLGEDVRFLFLNFHREFFFFFFFFFFFGRFIRGTIHQARRTLIALLASSTFRFSINREGNIVARRAAIGAIHSGRSFSIVLDPAIFRAAAI